MNSDVITISRGTLRPLLSIDAAKAILNRDEDAILSLIQSGDLAWAFDLRSPGTRRSFIRIYKDSIFQLLPTLRFEKHSIATLDDVLGEILPKPRRDGIKSPHLARCFNCGSTHIHALLSSRAIRKRGAKSGRTCAVEVSRESVESFLRRALVQ